MGVRPSMVTRFTPIFNHDITGLLRCFSGASNQTNLLLTTSQSTCGLSAAQQSSFSSRPQSFRENMIMIRCWKLLSFVGCHQWTWSTTPSTEIGSSYTISIRILSTWRPSSSFWWPVSINSIAPTSMCPKNTTHCLILGSCCNNGTFWKSRDNALRNSWAKDTILWTPIKWKLSMEITSAWKYSSSSISYNRSYKSTPRTGCLLSKRSAIPSSLVMTRYLCLSVRYQMTGSKLSETTSCSIFERCRHKAVWRLQRTTGILNHIRKMGQRASGLQYRPYRNPVSTGSALNSCTSFTRRVGSSSKCTNRPW